MLTLFVALFGLVANSMSMVVLFRPKIRAVAFNQLLFVLCGVDSFFLFCNSMSIGHALGLNNSKCDSKTFTEKWDSKRHLLELSWPIQRLRLIDHIFLGITLFCFSRQKAEIFSICLKKNFVKLHKISTQSNNGQKKWK